MIKPVTLDIYKIRANPSSLFVQKLIFLSFPGSTASSSKETNILSGSSNVPNDVSLCTRLSQRRNHLKGMLERCVGKALRQLRISAFAGLL